MKTEQKHLSTLIVPLLVSLLSISCKDDGTTPQTPERVRLTLIDVSVREIFLHVSVASPLHNETLALQRDGTTVMTFGAVADTNVADTGLTQTTTYKYGASLMANNSLTGTSNGITAETLAPTSHNFAWQTFLLGDGNNSALYDVALINDTVAYAVGEIYLTGDPTAYNLARWNGTEWQLQRVPVPLCGSGSTFAFPLFAIFAFGANDVWMSGGGEMERFDGNQFSWSCAMNGLISGALTRIWGTSSSGLWVVGRTGTVIYLHNGTWQRLQSGTATDVLDAWGVVNPATGKEEVYCAVTSFFTPGDKKILKITDGSRVDTVKWEPQRNIYSVWTNKGVPLFVCGSTVHEKRGSTWQELSYGSTLSVNAIRGTGLNDIVLVGDFGLISHFNGIEWQMVGYDFDAVYGAVAMTHNMIIAVGEKNSRGIITIGRRQ